MKKNVFVGTGISKNDVASKAGDEAVKMALDNMKKDGGNTPDFGVLFCSGTKYGKTKESITELVKSAHKSFTDANKEIKWIGCTTVGEISDYGVTKDSVVAMVISSKFMKFGVGVGEKLSKDPEKVGFTLAKSATEDLKLDREIEAYTYYLKMKKASAKELMNMTPFFFILLTKGVEAGIIPKIYKTYDNDAILRGAVNALGASIPIVGGSAGNWNMFKNYTFANGVVYENTVVGAAVYSSLYFVWALEHGYSSTGKVAFINDAKKNIIKKMNGMNALDAYSNLSGLSKDEISKNVLLACSKFPLGVSDVTKEYWLRVPIATFLGNLYVTQEVPKNTVLHVMHGSKKEIINAANSVVKRIKKHVSNKRPALSLVFSCAIRQFVLGDDVKKEGEIIKKSFGNRPFIGFYTMGEFGGNIGNAIGHHSQTLSIASVFEEKKRRL